MAGARGFFEKKSAEEQQKITEALKALGVDWTAGELPPGNPPALDVNFGTDHAGNEVRAGETITLRATVTNKGAVDALQVRAITRCDDPLLEDREFVFGRVRPGETRSWTVPVKVERAALARLDQVR